MGSEERLRGEASLSQSATHQEQRELTLRLKRCFLVGMVMWPCYTPLDFLAAREGASLPALLTVRVTVLLALVMLLWALSFKPKARGTIIIEVLAFSSVSAGLALHAILGDGFRAATVTSTFTVLVAQGLILPTPWRQGVARTAGPALIPPLGLGLAWLLRPELRVQFNDPTLMAEFMAYMGSYFAAWIVVLYAGNTTWELRRQIHENKLVGRYRLIERVGKGGMGEVWRAWHPTLKTEVALKLTNRAGEHELQRFSREIDALTAITHPGVVKIFDCGVTEDGLIFYTMELLHGQTLRQRFEDETRPLTVAEAIGICADVADALNAAHTHGIVHRDIKPENILLVPVDAPALVPATQAPAVVRTSSSSASSSASSGSSSNAGRVTAKLIDFGIAKNSSVSDLQATTLTATGAILGTPLYLSPEQALGQAVDARSDLYALGAVLYACLTGRPPFIEQTLTAVLLAHTQKMPTPPSLLVDGITPELDAVVLRCLEKKPDDRFASARALRDALLAVAIDIDARGGTAAGHFHFSSAAEAPTVDA